MGRACSQKGKGMSAFKTSTGRPTRKRPLRRPRRRSKENIKMDLQEKLSIVGIGLIRLRVEIIGKPL